MKWSILQSTHIQNSPGYIRRLQACLSSGIEEMMFSKGEVKQEYEGLNMRGEHPLQFNRLEET